MTDTDRSAIVPSPAPATPRVTPPAFGDGDKKQDGVS